MLSAGTVCCHPAEEKETVVSTGWMTSGSVMEFAAWKLAAWSEIMVAIPWLDAAP